MLKVFRLDYFTLKRPWWLEVLEAEPFDVLPGGEPFYSIGVALVGAFVIPEPVLAAVRKDDKRRFQVFRISPRLFFRVIRVKVLSLCFEHAQNAAGAVQQQVISPSISSMVFKPDL